MEIQEQADFSEQMIGLRAENVHEWIHDYIQKKSISIESLLKEEPFNPEGELTAEGNDCLLEAIQAFKQGYSQSQLEAILRNHIECIVQQKHTNKMPASLDRTPTDVPFEKILTLSERNSYFHKDLVSEGKEKSSKGLVNYQILFPTVLSIVLFISSGLAIFIPVFRNKMMDNKKEMIKELTVTTISMIQSLILKSETGELSREEAQKQAISIVRSLRYGKEMKDYFWITDMGPKMIMHPYRPDLDGQELISYRDRESERGKKIFVEFAKIVKNKGEGYIEYIWQWKDNPLNKVPKLSYVKGIPEWGWIVGTGIYINDVEEELNQLTQRVILIFGLISLFLSALLIRVIWVGNAIENSRLRAEKGLEEAKERYRALVESSNEGYVLQVEGEYVFSNKALHDLLGYDERTLAQMPLWEILDEKEEINGPAIEHLKKLTSTKDITGEYDVILKVAGKKHQNIHLRIAKIFLPEKKGHVVSFTKTRSRFVDQYSLNLSQDLFMGNALFKRVKDFMSPLGAEKKQPETDESELVHKNVSIFQAIELISKSKDYKLFVYDDKKKVTGFFGIDEVIKLVGGTPLNVAEAMGHSRSLGELINSMNKIPGIIKELNSMGLYPSFLRKMIGNFYDLAAKRITELVMEEIGSNPVPFCFISLGANARHEMSLFSEQNNIIVFKDIEGGDKHREYFLSLGDKICTMLKHVGFPYCQKGLMAANPTWCLSESEWVNKQRSWVIGKKEGDVKKLNIFMDSRFISGELSLFNNWRGDFFKLLDTHPDFFKAYAKLALEYKAPTNLFGKIKGEIKGGTEVLSLNECIRPLEIFSQVYALKFGVKNVIGSVERLSVLKDQSIINDEVYGEFSNLFEYFWKLRLQTQIHSNFELKPDYDDVELENIPEVERELLASFIGRISMFHNKMNRDFIDIKMT